MEENKNSNGMTINLNFSINIEDSAVKTLVDFLRKWNILQTLGINSNPAENADGKTAEEQKPAPRQKRKYSRRNGAQKSGSAASENKDTENPEINISAVCKTIREYAAFVQNGEDVNEVSALMRDEVSKMTNGRISVTFGRLGRYHTLIPNFLQTERVRAMFPQKWPGWVKFDRMFSVLNAAFTNEQEEEKISTTVLGGPRAKSHRSNGYRQGSYQRIKPGSMMMRMRCHKNSNVLAPMVIDSALADQLFTDGYTHVKIGMPSKGNVPVVNPQSINLIFSKEDVRTRAERKSKDKSRLHPYGKSSKDRNMNSTYCINGDAFQRTILNFFGDSCKGLEERVYKLVQTGDEKNGRIGYRIEKVM
jgi:hypothetical protein